MTSPAGTKPCLLTKLLIYSAHRGHNTVTFSLSKVDQCDIFSVYSRARTSHYTVLKLSSKVKPNRDRTEPKRFIIFSIFKNAAHILEPGEILGVSPGSKLCALLLNIVNTLKRFGLVADWLRLFFSIYFCSVM